VRHGGAAFIVEERGGSEDLKGEIARGQAEKEESNWRLTRLPLVCREKQLGKTWKEKKVAGDDT